MPTSEGLTTPTSNDLRAAAKVLRCEHSFPCAPPYGSLARPGPCTNCGVLFECSELVAEWLAEPLAAWLDSAAEDAEQIGTDPCALRVARTIRVQPADGGERP